MTPTVAHILLAEMMLAGVVWSAFVLHYQLTTRGRWARTEHGRNVMALAVCLALLIDLTIVSYLTSPTPQTDVPPSPTWLIWAALALWPTLAYVGIDRHRLLWRDQHPDREEN